MHALIVPSPIFQTAVRGVIEAVPGWTDAAWTVSLVEGSFNPLDPATYPSASTHFTPLVSDDAPQLLFDSSSSQYYLHAPDPAGGWSFASATITD